MRKIILASRSKARQKLLRQIGLKFQAVNSHVKEDSSPRPDCADLVIANALAKARDAAKRFSSGVVIGADTVVLAGKRIIGKPKNISDAFKTLKLLSRAPQLVYTGIAVVDIDHRKIFSDFERTKIYMYRLTDSRFGIISRRFPL